MTVRIFRPTYVIEELGELGRLPDGAIVNIGGTLGPNFTVGGRALLFADGTTTGPSGGGIVIQTTYDNSLTGRIDLTAGKNFVIQALNGKTVTVDAATGTLVVTGNLEVLGSSAVIEGVIQNTDQVSIGTPSSTTVGLQISPNAGVTPVLNLAEIRNVFGGPTVFSVDAAGTTRVTNLYASGLINGVDIMQLDSDVSSHLDASNLPAKHAASQISVTPLSNFPGVNVQEVLEAISVAASGGSVTSVSVTSPDMTVTGSPITTVGTIDLTLNTIPISKGGTGEVTAAAAINALVPTQTGNSGKVLGTNGTTVEWISSAGLTGAGLFFINAAPTGTGIVASKQYVAGTVPANKVIFDATSDTNNVTVTLFAEGDSAFYSPTVTVTTVPPQAGGPLTAGLVEDTNDKRSYTATAFLTGITVPTVVYAVSSTGASATMTIQRAAAGPAITALTIGSLPGTQTEAKSGDVVPVTGIIENSATYAEVIAGGAANALSVLTVGAADSAGVGFKTISGNFTVGSGTGALSIQARGRNALGTFGGLFTSTNTITLNQTYPTIGPRSIVYPATQLALKLSETATVSATVTNADVVVYTATNLSVASSNVYAVTKTVTRTGGTYSFGTNNYTITATKTSNGAVATASSAVSIADVAPTCAITIVGSPARLQSSPGGVDYTVTITANQQLLVAPTLIASSGVWQGGGWAGSGTTWTRVLRILDTSPKGAQLFSTASLVGLAGIPGSAITSGAPYTVGGFAPRVITFAPFERFHAIGTTVVDITKVTASYTGSTVLTFHPDTGDYFQGFSIVNASGVYDPTGGYLFISDLAFSGANTTGTLQLTIGEAV